MIAFAVMLGSLALSSGSTDSTCGLPEVTYSGELYDALARRAAEAIDRAGQSAWKADDKLIDFVAPDAEFGVGAGDVGRPLGKGRAGLRAMALLMRADHFAFMLWAEFLRLRSRVANNP